MKILLVAMPDTAEVLHCSSYMPNLGLISLAGQLEGHEVRVLDLVAHRPRVRKPLLRQIESFRPDWIGLSAMTFQFDTLLRIARLIRQTHPSIPLAAGGYHATLMARELADDPDLPLDYLIRGEGEQTVVELAAALQAGRRPEDVVGLSYRYGTAWRHNPDRPLADLSTLRLPDRDARVFSGFHYYGLPMDVAETSRGCPFNCKFCSITHMYGHTFRPFPMDRIVADLRAIRARGAKAVFIVDDNITYDIAHFRDVCRAIIDNGLHDLVYAVQASAAGLANHPDLVADMDRANFRTVFVGLESMNATALQTMHKPTSPEINRRAADLLHRHNMALIAGIIVGFPEDTRESVRENLRLFRELRPEALYAQYLTPYPKTKLRDEMIEAGLIDNPDRFDEYDGFSCNVRTHALSRDELFRLLKLEALKFALKPSLHGHNYFLRRHPFGLIRAVSKILCMDLYNIVTGRRFVRKLDV